MGSIEKFVKENSQEALDKALGAGYSMGDIESALNEYYQIDQNSGGGNENGPGNKVDSAAEAKQFSNSLAGKGNPQLGQIARTVTNAALGYATGNNPAMSGVRNSIAGMVEDITAGREVDPKDVLTDGVKGAAGHAVNSLTRDVVGNAAPVVGGLVGMGVDAAIGKDVDFTRGLFNIGGGYIGSMVLGPFAPVGGFVGSKVGDWAYNGPVGDGLNIRSHEQFRDVLEDDGASYKDSEQAAGHYSANQKSIEAAINGDPSTGGGSGNINGIDYSGNTEDDDEAYA
jgi:hypothetical protein